MGQLVPRNESFSPSQINQNLNTAMKELVELCERIDSGEDLDDLMLETFSAIKEDATRFSDSAIAFEMSCDAAIAHAKQMQEVFYSRRKTIEGIKEKFRDQLKDTVERFQDEIQVKGSLGTLSIKAKPPSVKYHCLIKDSVSVSSVVPDDVVKQFGITPEYLTPVLSQKLNKAKVLADLKAGVELSWAELIKGETSLAVRKV